MRKAQALIATSKDYETLIDFYIFFLKPIGQAVYYILLMQENKKAFAKVAEDYDVDIVPAAEYPDLLEFAKALVQEYVGEQTGDDRSVHMEAPEENKRQRKTRDAEEKREDLRYNREKQKLVKMSAKLFRDRRAFQAQSERFRNMFK